DERFDRLQAEHAEQKTQHEQLANDLAQLRASLSQQPDPAQPARPVVTGGGASVLTDC
ncbi:GPO family capsid scaffolding protein, partial [Xanthomonas vasicola]|uniref:GPO family capsid scaffolding protein n=1 Tax=Xanthomonas vasicola TaxID=56459 RepID=UPI0004D41FFF